MSPGTKIFLVGMPGSGKSTLGKVLADKMRLQFVDLDDELEKVQNTTIKEIFAIDGEDKFRVLEKAQLEQSIRETVAFVMATGGGTPCFFNNMEVMMASGIVVFLDVPPKELSKRLIEGKGICSRPMFKESKENNVSMELEKKWKDRLSDYHQAHIVVKGDQISSVQIQEAVERYQ